MSIDASFATLGLSAGAEPTEIVQAFRALSRRWHPDTGGDSIRFASIVEAYRALQRAGLVNVESSVGDTRGGRELGGGAFIARARSRVVVPCTQWIGKRTMAFTDQIHSQRQQPSQTTGASGSMPAGDSFAEILERELRRVGDRQSA